MLFWTSLNDLIPDDMTVSTPLCVKKMDRLWSLETACLVPTCHPSVAAHSYLVSTATSFLPSLGLTKSDTFYINVIQLRQYEEWWPGIHVALEMSRVMFGWDLKLLKGEEDPLQTQDTHNHKFVGAISWNTWRQIEHVFSPSKDHNPVKQYYSTTTLVTV